MTGFPPRSLVSENCLELIAGPVLSESDVVDSGVVKNVEAGLCVVLDSEVVNEVVVGSRVVGDK